MNKDEKNHFDEGFNKIDIAYELKLEDKEDVDVFVSNGKANIIVQELNTADYFTMTKRIYSYDFKTNKINEITTFNSEKWILAFTELSNSYVYAYIEKKDSSSYTLSIEEVKGTKSNLITTATIQTAGTNDFRPYFITRGNAVYFMLSDFGQSDNSKINLNQKFIKYENETMNILYETNNVISSNSEDTIETNNIFYTNQLFSLTDGQILFQEFTLTSSRLLLYKGNEIIPYELNTSKEHLRGFIDKYAVIFSKDEQKHYLYNLKTKEKRNLDYDTPIYKAQTIGSNTMYIKGSMRDDILVLQNNSDFKIQSFDATYDLLRSEDKDNSMLFLYTDGNDVLMDVTTFINDKPIHNFYSLQH